MYIFFHLTAEGMGILQIGNTVELLRIPFPHQSSVEYQNLPT